MAKWEQLVAAREQRHLSQLEAAEQLNVGLVTYQRWELGKRKPQPQNMRHLCELFGTQLEPGEVVALSRVSLVRQDLDVSPEPPTVRALREERPVTSSIPEDDNTQALLTANMTSHLWSLALMDHPTYNDKRYSIRQAIKERDSMNTNNQNYQMTRREALCSLATLPIVTLGLATPGKTVLSSQYQSALAHCSASLEACWELYRSGSADETALAFKCSSKYLSILSEISKDSSKHREEALDLATRYALIKTLVGWSYVGPIETIQYARDAVTLSKETGDISLQLSAYSKLTWTYFFTKKYTSALAIAQEAEMLFQSYSQSLSASPLHPCIEGGTYSALAVMQAKNGINPDVALGKSFSIAPGNETYAFLDFTEGGRLLQAGWAYCYQGNQAKAQEVLEMRVHPETLAPKIMQSASGRVETVNVMVLSSLRAKNRDMEKILHLWLTGMQGARDIQHEQRFNEALANYELMEAIWSGERRVAELRGYIEHWDIVDR